MRKLFRSWFSGGSKRSSQTGRRELSRRSLGFRKAALETLEVRAVLSANLYLDFGDAFFGPNGLSDWGQPVTAGELRDEVTGPDFFSGTADATPIRFTPFNAEAAAAGLNPVQIAEARLGIVKMVERYYAPFGVTVIPTAVTYLDQISLILGAAASHDSYVLVAGTYAAGLGTGLNGQAGGMDDLMAGVNAHDDTAVVLANNMFGNGSATAANVVTAFGYCASHESGHNFGLKHAFNTQDYRNPGNVLQFSEAMGYDADLDLVSFFTRYPMVTDYMDVTFDKPGDARIYYDWLADPDLVGLRPFGSEFVTGTGAHDVITITSAGFNRARVTVEAFTDAAHTAPIAVPQPVDMNPLTGNIIGQDGIHVYNINIPAVNGDGNVFSYTIDISRGIVVDGGEGCDTLVVDASLRSSVTYRGGGDDNTLVVQDAGWVGKVAAMVGSYNGAIMTGTMFGGRLLTVAETDNLVMVLGNGSDTVKITSTAVAAAGLNSVTIYGNGGNDTIAVTGRADCLLDGGLGNDTLTVLPDGFRNSILLGGPGRDTLIGGRGHNLLIGGTGSDMLKGGLGESIFIGGTTLYDADAAALRSIMAEWSTPQNTATRVGHLTLGGGLNGGNVLVKGTLADTVFDDGAADFMIGSPLADWVLRFAGDFLQNRQWFDVVT